jgi:hypothetical protein
MQTTKSITQQLRNRWKPKKSTNWSANDNRPELAAFRILTIPSEPATRFSSTSENNSKTEKTIKFGDAWVNGSILKGITHLSMSPESKRSWPDTTTTSRKLSTFKLITTSRGSSIETENLWKALLLPLISNNFILMKF